MDKKLPRLVKKYTLFLLLFGMKSGVLYAQILNKPVPDFENPCASEGFNTYQVAFSWIPTGAFGADNEFILELSGPEGSFSNRTELSRVGDQNNSSSSSFNFQFNFPVTTAGDNYRLRVRSTSPENVSAESNAFSAYYRRVNQQLTINEINGTVVGTVALCPGGSYELSVANYPDEASYIWYRNGMVVSGETGPSITISQAGKYQAEVNYGQYCSSDTSSNEVTVTIGGSMQVSINDGLPELDICSGDNAGLMADVDNPSYIYTWYKDGVQVGTPSYQPELFLNGSDPSGEYYLRLENPGGCTAQSNSVQVSAPSVSVSTDADSNVLLLPGDNITINASTNAGNPQYTWYKDNVVISGETTASLVVTAPGVYKVKVVQGSGCSLEAFSPEVNVSYPQEFTIHIAHDVEYNPCVNAFTILKLDGIYATAENGTSVDVLDQYKNEFNYQWYRNGNYLDGKTGTSLTIDQPSDNGAYTLKATFGDDIMVSGEMDIKLRLQETVSIEASDDILCGGSITINITTGTGNTDYTYAWYKDGEKISENTTALNIEEEGTYRLGVSAYGCTVFSNELVIHPFDDSVIEVDAPERIIIPEGATRTVTASGGDSYSWFRADNELISDSDSVEVSTEGDLVLLAYIGNCEVVRNFTVEFQDSYIIPNVVSPNNDGINDYWVLPNIYAFNPEVEVTIFSPNGSILLKTTEYQNNWPESTMTYAFNKPVFFYRIVKGGEEVVRQGTITLIR
ncbi:T9SS type B sorting domain-containing protein [Sinomicrobium pectinilyticum]|nr:gliding motility-associated C-terminal domain-containing protein [Sinomicrobium pectinilyticum]